MDEDVKRWLYWAIPIVVVIGAGVALYYNRMRNAPEPAPVAQTQAPPSVAPPVQHPIEEVGDDKPLPALADSDAQVQDSLVGAALPSMRRCWRRRTSCVTVVTVDNLPRKKVAAAVAGEAGRRRADCGARREPTLSPENAERYAPFVNLVKNADVAQVASVYRHFIRVPAGASTCYPDLLQRRSGR